MAQLPHSPKGNSCVTFCLKIFTRWINAYRSRVLLKYSGRTRVFEMYERLQEGFGRCYLERVNTLALERTGSLFQPHDYVSRQTKPNSFQDPRAGLVWFLNLTAETLTWGRWMWKFCHWLSWTGVFKRSGEPCHAAWRVSAGGTSGWMIFFCKW